MASNNNIVSASSSPSLTLSSVKRSSSLSPSFSSLSQSMLGQHDNLAEKEATRFFQTLSVEEIRSKQAESRYVIKKKGSFVEKKMCGFCCSWVMTHYNIYSKDFVKLMS